METDNHLPPPDNPTLKEGVFSNAGTFADHGNEIEEIISHRPPLIVRWGTVYFFLLLLFIGMISWLIQYPDIVIAKARLSSVNAPKEVITRTDGKLVKILVKENEEVVDGETLAYMESIANPTSVNAIRHQLDSITVLISQNHTDKIIQFLPSNNAPVSGIRDEALGELQTPYQIFSQAFITFRDFLSSGFYLRKKSMLLKDMQNIQKLNSILSIQKTLLDQDLSLSNETYDANKSLAAAKVISSLDYRNEKSKLIAKQLSLPQINTSIVLNESQQNEKRKEIAELENQIIVQKNIFIQALQTMKSQVQAWEYKYLLKAPVAGSVSLTGFFQENQEMKAGQTLFYIQPANTSYFVEMLVPQYNFGKVRKGQRVLLKFQAYPNEQYGAVNGIIDYINTTPSDSGYLAKVILPNRLVTNYNKPLQYHNGLTAQAEIITEDMRLLERFYYNLVKQMRR